VASLPGLRSAALPRADYLCPNKTFQLLRTRLVPAPEGPPFLRASLGQGRLLVNSSPGISVSARPGSTRVHNGEESRGMKTLARAGAAGGVLNILEILTATSERALEL
jgi:hypothetical protein